MRVFKTLRYIFFIVFIIISTCFFDAQKTSAYFQFTKTASTSFTMATYQSLSLATDRETYGLCNKNATILLTVGNTNAYNTGYTITFSNNGLTYTIDGASATTYTLPANGSKTHTIVVSGTTTTQSLTITVTPNSPYGSIHNKVVTFDLVCPVCTWGGVNSTNQYLKNKVTSTYTIDCTDALGITSDNLTSSAFTVSNTALASVNGVTKSAITNGYRYTVSLLGKTGNGNVTISLKANTVKDTNLNGNALKTSGTIIVDNTAPTLTLDKEGVVEGFKGWNIGSASIDSNGYLGFASESSTSSYYYPVDESYYYWTFEATATSASTQYSPNGGWYSGTSYYDANFAAFTGSNGYSSNGQASSIPLNTWKAFAAGNYNYGTGLEYFSINLTSGSPYANATTKYRNFKMYGNIFARNKYTIKVTASDANNVVLKKYASGSQTTTYFTSDGTTFTSDTFDVTSNGTYTVYLKDTAGNETIQTIVINKIDNTAPAISNFAQNSAWGTTNTLTATATDSSAGIVAYAFTSTNEEPTSWIRVNNTTSAKTVTNTVSSNGTYYVWFVDAAGNVSSSSTSVNKIDTGLPSCSWGTLSNVTATTTKTFDITCTDTLSGIQSATLTTSNFVSSDTSKATVTSVSAPVAVTNGYKYTVTTTGVAAGTFTLSLNAESVRDNATNSNAAATSGAISVVRNTASMTVSSATSSLTYGSSTGSVTYTYSGNATPTVVSSAPGVATVSINTTTKTITITPVTAGTSTITLSAGQTNQYNAISKTIAVTVNKRAVTITAGSTSRDYNGSALTYASCTGNNLVSGQTVTCTMTAASTITNVGSVANTINTRVIKSGSTDVTSNYTVTNATGTLTITRLKSATTGSCSSLTYNGASQTLASGAANASYSNNAGTNATSYTVTVTAGSNYAFSDGATSKTLSCSIAKRSVTYKAANASKTYDGTALTNASGCSLTSGSLVSGHAATCTNTGTITNAGSATNTLSTVVIKSGTTNLSSNYAITKTNGTLTVTAKPLTVASFTYSPTTKVYDGTTAKPSGFAVTATTASGLISGDSVTVAYTGAVYNNANVASATGIAVTGMSLGGTSAANYTLNATSYTKSANITRSKSATTGSCSSLTYNGASRTLASGAANASYSNNAGTNATSYTVTVTAGANYAFSDGSTSKTLGCSIGKRPITITAKAQSIIEGNSIATGVGQVTYTATSTNAGLASGHSLDAITLTPSTLNIGTGTITPSGAVIESSTITTNYSITYSTGVLTVLIPARTYTVTFYKNGAALIGGSTAEYVTRSCTIPAGNTSTTCAITTPTISGASATPNVIGWGTTPDSHTAATGTNSTLNVGNNGAYYAQTRSSQSSYSALFYRNTATTISGSSATSVTRSCSTTITYNGITTITTCDITAPSIEKSGYIILGWSTSATTPTALISQSSTMTLSGSTEVYYAITGWSGNNMCNVTGAVTNPYNSAQCIFRGAAPNNYVKFNNVNYRIIGSDNSGKVKFIWNDSTLSGRTSYTYTVGDAYALMNSGTYYTGLSSTAKNLITSTTFNIGTVSFYNNTDKYIGNVAPAENATTGTYSAGLLQVSEFLYASTASGCTSTTPWSTFNSSPYICTSSNWLLTGYPFHFINNHSSSRIKYLKDNKQISYDTSTVSAKVKPVHSFKMNVVFISGSGTSTDPYIPFLNPTSFTCSISTSSGYQTSKTLTITTSSGVTLHSSPYSWNNSVWTTSNSTSVSAAGTYRAYVRDVNGTTATCMIKINGREEYRYLDCLNENKTFTSWSYHSFTTVQNKSSCNYPHSAAEADYATWAKLWDNRSDDECPDFGFTAPCYLCDEWTRAVTCSSYDGSSWSGWSTTAATASSIKQVETRTTYWPA